VELIGSALVWGHLATGRAALVGALPATVVRNSCTESRGTNAALNPWLVVVDARVWLSFTSPPSA
jgi:hypothetical protein